jgi:hypothetical protein
VRNKNYLTAWSFISFAFFILLLTSGCNKNNGKGPDANFTGITATINGKPWKCSKPVCTYDTIGGSIFITGAGDAGSPGTMALAVADSGTIGLTEPLRTEALEAQFTNGGGTMYASDWFYGAYGNSTLTAMDKSANRVSGTFSGVFFNPNSTRDSITVADGKFGGTYTKE